MKAAKTEEKMNENKWSRREVLKVIPALALGADAIAGSAGAQAVKWSSGKQKPATKMPQRATDCHMHIYDARLPADPKAVLHPADALVTDYRMLQARLGSSRTVMVQPSTYGLDNRLLLQSIAELGLDSARGVAVVNTEVKDADLKNMHAAGVRGIRFNLVQAGATSFDMVEPLARRVAPLGWHIQIHAVADQILGVKEIWQRLPCPVVFDHLGRIPQPDGSRHPAFALIGGLLQQGKAWVKISGFYYETRVGPPTYADSAVLAKAYIKEAPERLVWGSDWPHPTEKENAKPDDALLFDVFSGCVPDENLRNRILADNASRLYGF
jgi:D-galactarolactone isomerase